MKIMNNVEQDVFNEHSKLFSLEFCWYSVCLKNIKEYEILSRQE